jgi:hypothetical protein
MCDEWRAHFPAFLKHIGPRPSKRHSLDRIDNRRGYEPGNVRWATRRTQSSNRGTVIAVRLTTGEVLTLMDVTRRTGISHRRLCLAAQHGAERVANVSGLAVAHVEKRAR